MSSRWHFTRGQKLRRLFYFKALQRRRLAQRWLSAHLLILVLLLFCLLVGGVEVQDQAFFGQGEKQPGADQAVVRPTLLLKQQTQRIPGAAKDAGLWYFL